MKNIGGGATRLRQINREIARRAFRESGPLSKAGLAAATGLSLATAANVIRDLLDAGEVTELDERESRGGRPASRYAVNPGHSLVAAIVTESAGAGEGGGCGAGRLSYAVADSLGTVVKAGAANDPADPAGLDRLLSRLHRQYPAIKAAALSLPGVVNGGRVGICDVTAMEGAELEKTLRHRHGMDILVENDVKFAAVGYYRSRRDLEEATLAYIAFGDADPPGAGIIVNGTLARGRSGFAGEVSFIPLASGHRREAGRGGKRGLRYIADVAAAMVAVVNPDVVVLAGPRVGNLDPAGAAALCGESIPAAHLPEFITKADYAADMVSGMLASAREALSCEVRLVVKKRNWCDNA